MNEQAFFDVLRCPDGVHDAFTAYQYARIHSTIPEAVEGLIGIDPYYAYIYAKDMIKGRFILGEKALAVDANYAYLYSKFVLDGRFILGERALATDAYYAYCYASEVMYGRFVLGEYVISVDPVTRYLYTTHILEEDFYYEGKLIVKYKED